MPKVINHIEGLYYRGKTYPCGTPIEADDFLLELAKGAKQVNGIVAVTVVQEEETTVNTKKEVKEEISASAKITDNEEWFCSECNKQFKSKIGYISHMRKHK